MAPSPAMGRVFRNHSPVIQDFRSYRALQVKFAASSVLPLPLYTAT